MIAKQSFLAYPPVSQLHEKKLLANAALEHMGAVQRIAVGAGSSVQVFLETLADRQRSAGLPTCEVIAPCLSSYLLCEELGLKVRAELGTGGADCLVDGADEICLDQNSLAGMLKGGGGSLYKEKLLFEALAEKPRYILVSKDKLSATLGEGGAPLTLEVIPSKLSSVLTRLREKRFSNFQLRSGKGLFGPLFTEQGNLLLDIHIATLDREHFTFLTELKDVFCHGFFPLPSQLLIADGDTVERQEFLERFPIAESSE